MVNDRSGSIVTKAATELDIVHRMGCVGNAEQPTKGSCSDCSVGMLPGIGLVAIAK